MNTTKICKLIFGILFIAISIYSFRNYIEFKSAISESKPIEYSFIDRKINKGGRGESYDIIVKYKNIEETISITSKDYDLIENSTYPELYYAESSRNIFSKWSIKMHLRITIIFFLLSIITIFPWNVLKKHKALK